MEAQQLADEQLGGATVTANAVCFGCGYTLQGLDANGVCPECGFAIERSLRGSQLVNSSPEYVQSLKRGATVVFAGMVTSLIADVLLFVGAIVFIVLMIRAAQSQGGTGITPFWFQVIPGLVSAGLSFVILLGWWMASTPDPGFQGRDDGSTARLWLRVSVGILAAAQLLNAGLTLGMGATMSATMGGMSLVVVALAALVGLVALVAWGVWFFTSLQYIRWLAPRFPDRAMSINAKRNMWLLPLLYIIGSILVIGPTIAKILYAHLMWTLRTRLDAVQRQQAALDA